MSEISKIMFIGSKRIGLRCLDALSEVIPGTIIGAMTLDDRGDTRCVFKELEAECSKRKIRLSVAKNRSDSEGLIKKLKPQMCVVVGWYWLIGKDVLDLVPHGFLGIHNSLLPKYRGGAPVNWALINGDDRVGVSLFAFAPGMDDGPIWGQRAVEVGFEDNIGTVLEKLENEAVSMIREKFPLILEGKAKPVPQNQSGVSYGAQRNPEDGLIDWKKSAVEIHNFVRGQSEPYPGAFTFLKGEKLTVWRARPLEMKYFGEPGQVARVADEGVYVIAGNQMPLLVMEVSKGAGKRIRASLAIKTRDTRFSSVST